MGAKDSSEIVFSESLTTKMSFQLNSNLLLCCNKSGNRRLGLEGCHILSINHCVSCSIMFSNGTESCIFEKLVDLCTTKSVELHFCTISDMVLKKPEA